MHFYKNLLGQYKETTMRDDFLPKFLFKVMGGGGVLKSSINEL